MRAKMPRGVDDTRASVGRRHRSRSHGRPGLGMDCLVLTQDTVGLVGEACKRLGLLGALTPRHDGRGWRALGRSAAAGPGSVQHDKQPQESQHHELRVKEVWNHGSAPSPWDDRGTFYLVFGAEQLSAGYRYTTRAGASGAMAPTSPVGRQRLRASHRLGPSVAYAPAWGGLHRGLAAGFSPEGHADDRTRPLHNAPHGGG